MRILVITQYFWPEGFRINDLVGGLVQRGHEVVVLTGLPNYPSGKFADGYGLAGPYAQEFAGAKVVRAPISPRGNRSFLLLLNYLTFALAASLIGPFRCKGRFNAIFVYEPSPIFVGIPARVMAWLKGAPILFWVQDLWPESLSATGAVKSPWIIHAVEGVVRWIYKGCSLILVQSKAFVGPVQRLGVPDEKIVYFPNSAEDLYRPVARGDGWNGPQLPDGFRIMFAGNIGAAQSFDTILSAAEMLREARDIHWIILGEGRQSSWVRQEVERRGLTQQVHLLGRHPVETMPEWFGQADVMLVALRRDPAMAMTIPAKVQSYLACGKAIVASLDGEGARVVEESGAGLATASEDPAALANAVRRLHDMPPEERDALGARGNAYFRSHFARDKLLDQLETWLTEYGRRLK